MDFEIEKIPKFNVNISYENIHLMALSEWGTFT